MKLSQASDAPVGTPLAATGRMIYDGWQGLLRTVLVGALAYVSLVLLLRVSGKRTLSKLNAFDLVVTVALGSTLATVLLSQDVALAEGVAAFALLIGLQWVITWCSVRSQRFAQLVKAEPRLLYYKGRFLADALKRERITETELRAAVRAAGALSMESVDAVVLETDGSVAVIVEPTQGPPTALKGVQGEPEHP